MIRPPKVTVLLLSVHPLSYHGLLQLHLTLMTDLPIYLPLQLLIVLTSDQNISTE